LRVRCQWAAPADTRQTDPSSIMPEPRTALSRLSVRR
jgi:hypothetical protein